MADGVTDRACPARHPLHRWAVAAGALALAVAPLAAPGFAGRAHADDATPVSATGIVTANGVGVDVLIPNYLIVQDVATGVPTAQSQYNSAAQSGAGFAALPYPGDTIVNAPALVSVLLGRSFPLSYPVYAVSRSGDGPQAVQNQAAGLSLTADSEEGAVVANATEASPGGNPSASSIVCDTSSKIDGNGNLVVTGDSDVKGLTVAGVLTIGEVHTHVVTTYDHSGGKPTNVASTVITGASIAGVPVSIGGDGLKVAGTALGGLQPLLGTINAALAAAKVKVSALSVTNTDTGAIAGGLQIVTTQTIPAPGNPMGTVTYSVGGVTTSVVAGSGAGVYNGTPPSTTTPPVTSPTPPAAGSAPPAGSTTGTGSTGSVLPVTGTTGGALAGAAPLSSPPQLAAPAAPAVTMPQTMLLARQLGHPLRVFYLVLLVGGLAGMVSTALWKLKGAKARWTS